MVTKNKKKTNTLEEGKLWFWNSVKAMAAIIALAGAFYAFDARFAKSEDLKKQEQQTIKTFEMFQNKFESKYLQDRLSVLQDQKRQVLLMLKKTPNDVELKEQLAEVNDEIRVTKEKLNEAQKK